MLDWLGVAHEITVLDLWKETKVMEDIIENIRHLPLAELTRHPLDPYRVTCSGLSVPCGRSSDTPKPLEPARVRPKNGGYEIVGGQSSYSAALAASAANVLCQIVDIDEIETLHRFALRYRRDVDDPLRLGQVFQALLGLNSWSQDELAAAVEKTAGTIRNHLRYVDALERRIKYANLKRCSAESDIDAATVIGRLTIAQVRTYLGLPAEIGDPWLDAGAPLDPVTAHVLKGIENRKKLDIIVQRGWACHLSHAPDDFADSVARLTGYLEWSSKNTLLPHAEAYLNPVIEWELPPLILDCLPTKGSKPSWWLYLTPAIWTKFVEQGAELDIETGGLCAWFRDRIDGYLTSDKVKAKERAFADGRKALNVFHAPDFIRDAPCLTTDEKSRLAEFKPEGADDLIIDAKRRTCERIHVIRTTKGWDEPIPDIRRVCSEILAALREEQWLRSCESLMQRPGAAVEKVLELFSTTPAFKSGVVIGRPASEVLRQNIAGLSLPELAIVACSLRPTMAPRLAKLWLHVAGGEIPQPASSTSPVGDGFAN